MVTYRSNIKYSNKKNKRTQLFITQTNLIYVGKKITILNDAIIYTLTT